jgi:outer membrane protein insertion porin family
MRALVLSGLILSLVLLCSGALRAQTVSGISVEGNRYVSTDRILLTFGLRIGEEPTAEALREGVHRLYDLGNFSDVQVYAEDAEGGAVALVVVVEERPRVTEIEITGNDKIGTSDIRDVVVLEEGRPADPGKIEDSRAAILALYDDEGFLSASVDIVSEPTSENTVKVRVAIDEGSQVTVTSIGFEGITVLDETDLQKVMETKEDRWWRTDAHLDRDALREDLDKLVARYHEEGYIDAKVAGYETEFDETGERVDITIIIEEGELYTISAVEWTGTSEFAANGLINLTRLRVGDVYRPALAEESIRDAYSWYGERGYIHVRIYHTEDVQSANELRLVFHVDEGEPAKIGQIHIVGNSRTQEKIIRRELTVKPGDLYQTSEVIASQRKVANLGFFDGPFVEFAEGADQDNIDLVFAVEERQTGRAGVGVSHTSERGITGFIELSEANLFGNGRFLDLKWEFGKNNTELILGFTEPWFMDRELSVGFDIYDTDDRRYYTSLGTDFYEDAYPDSIADEINRDDASSRYIVERKRRGGALRIGWPFFGSRTTMLYGRYTLEQFNLHEYTEVTVTDSTGTDTDTYTRIPSNWEWRSGITGTLVRRTTDRRFHPRLGSYTRFTADLFGNAMGGDVEYQRYVLDTRKFIPVFWRTTFTLHARGGLVTGYGDPNTVPQDTRFELGGVGLNGVRGYDNRAILPSGNELYGGRTMLLGGLELKFAVTDEREQMPIYVLGFVDAGNTWNAVELTDPTNLFWGVGAGVRLEVPVLGNLGIDVGYGFDDVIGGQWRVHYQFGIEY